MKYIGIIAAMDDEVTAIKKLMKDIKKNEIFKTSFIEGKIHSKAVVLVKSGVGKVNAGRVAQILIDKYDIEYIINVGTAGSLNENIEIGDIVIGEKLLQHDFNFTACGYEIGCIGDTGKYFESDKTLIAKSKNIIENMNEDFKAIIGLIATGDIFVQDIEVKNKIKKEFNADCAEMEGAAIAQVCTLDSIPFLVVRSISDKPNGNNGIDFKTYLKMACQRYAKFIDFLLK